MTLRKLILQISLCAVLFFALALLFHFLMIQDGTGYFARTEEQYGLASLPSTLEQCVLGFHLNSGTHGISVEPGGNGIMGGYSVSGLLKLADPDLEKFKKFFKEVPRVNAIGGIPSSQGIYYAWCSAAKEMDCLYVAFPRPGHSQSVVSCTMQLQESESQVKLHYGYN